MERRRQTKQETKQLTASLLHTFSDGLVYSMISNASDHELWLKLREQGEKLSDLACLNKLPPDEIRGADLNWRLGVDAVHIVMGDCKLEHH